MTLAELKQEILIRLGSPVINIELADTQMDVYIKDAVDKFIETHMDGVDEGYIIFELTKDVLEYTIPTNIHSISDVQGVSSSLIKDEPLLLQSFIMTDFLYGSPVDLPSLEIWKQDIKNFQSYFSNKKRFEFNATTHKLKIFNADVSESVMLKVQISPTSEEIYNNSWFKKYVTCLCKLAWGKNISKYVGGSLPGGVSLNYDLIISEAKEEKLQLEEELFMMYQEPIDFLVG